MRTLAFIIGLAAGFWLVEQFLTASHDAAPSVAAAPKAPVALPTPATPVVDPPPAANPALPPPPARAHRFAYFLTISFSIPSATGISEEDLSDPQFAELYRRAVLGRARDEAAPLVYALQLSSPQYSALLEAIVDQAQTYHQRRKGHMNTPLHEALMAELSQATEARLATVLTPEQMEKFAVLRFRVQAIGNMAESFAQRGAPLSVEQMDRLLTLKPVVPPAEVYSASPKKAAESNPEPDWKTDAQRRYETDRLRWQTAAELKDAMRSVKVKDPELRDMWPE